MLFLLKNKLKPKAIMMILPTLGTQHSAQSNGVCCFSRQTVAEVGSKGPNCLMPDGCDLIFGNTVTQDVLPQSLKKWQR
jgi:hypothetical protein